MTFGIELGRYRRAAGLSLADLARLVHYGEGFLGKVETGAAGPDAVLAGLCDAALGTGGALSALLPDGGPSSTATLPAVPAPSLDLPPVPGPFRGRTAEVHTVLTGEDTVCVVSGTAGAGKTALAVHCAHAVRARFPDGCFFLDLRGAGACPVEAGEALGRFLRCLGVSPGEIPRGVDARARAFRARLSGRRVLAILDDAASIAQVRPLLPDEPGCRALVTSRADLAALDAHHLPLRALPRRDAVEWLGPPDTARERVAERCGRLPLALRITAARPPSDPSSFDGQLTDGDDRGVAWAFRVSCRRLGAGRTRLLGLLALHPGTEIEPAAAVALAGAETGLDDLCDANLLDRAGGRYRIHDLLKTFARDGCPDTERKAALGRLLDFAVERVAAVDALIAPHDDHRVTAAQPSRVFGDQAEALRWIAREAETLTALVRIAAEQGFPGRCRQLAALLRSFFRLDEQGDAWAGTHRLALTAARAERNPAAEAVVHAGLGGALLDLGDTDDAAGHLHAALDLFQDLGDDHGVAVTRAYLARVSHRRGYHHTAVNDLTAALDFFLRHEARRDVALVRCRRSLAETALGRYADAAADAGDALEIFDELGLGPGAATAAGTLAWAHFKAGQLDDAGCRYAEALARARRARDTFETARAGTGAGNVHAVAGRRAEAEEAWRRADLDHPGFAGSAAEEAVIRTELGS